MTEVQIYGGPRDGERFELAGNPLHGELVIADGSRFRTYERTDGSWVGVWVGFDGPPYSDTLEDDWPLTDDEARKLLRAIEADRERATAAEVFTALAVGAAVGVAFGLGLLIIAAFGWALTWVAGALGWTNLVLAAGAVGAVALTFHVWRHPSEWRSK